MYPALTEPSRKPDKVSVWILNQELANARLNITSSIPFFLRLHEKRPIYRSQGCQDWVNRAHLNLEVNTSPKRNFHWSDYPISATVTLLQHDLRAIQIKVGEAFMGPVIGDAEAT